MNSKIISAIILCIALTASAVTPYMNRALDMPNAISARWYFGVTNPIDWFFAGSNVVFTARPAGGVFINAAAGGAAATGVTNFQAGNLSPLFTTSESDTTTFPSLTFNLTSQDANRVFAGPSSGGAAAPTFRALVADDIPALSYVTSVGLSLPGSVFSVSGSPVTGAGTLSGSFQNQSANTVFAGPDTGAAAAPAFRALVAADIPALPYLSSAGLTGRFQRPVQANADGSLYAATNWPDMSLYEFDEEFDGGNQSNGQIGKYGWLLALGGSGNLTTLGVAVHNLWGFTSLGKSAGTGNSFASLSIRWTGTSSSDSIIWTNVSNLQGVFRWMHITTNVGDVMRLGFDSTRQFFPPANGFWVGWATLSNTTSYFFELRSNSISAVTASSITVASNTMMTCQYWATNTANGIWFSINGEAPVLVSSNVPSAAVTPSIVWGSSNTLSSALFVDRFAFRVSR